MRRMELIEQIAATVGMKKASQVVDTFLASAGLQKKDEYSRDEILRFCDAIRDSGDTLLRLTGTCIKTRLIVKS